MVEFMYLVFTGICQVRVTQVSVAVLVQRLSNSS